MTVKAIGDNVVIKVLRTMISKGGIELPFGSRETSHKGEIVDIGQSITWDVNGLKQFGLSPTAYYPYAVGDTVIIGIKAKPTIVSEDLWIIRKSDIVGVVQVDE